MAGGSGAMTLPTRYGRKHAAGHYFVYEITALILIRQPFLIF